MDRDVAASRNGAFLLLSFWHGGARHTDFWCVERWRSREIVAESGEKKKQRASAIVAAESVAGRVSLTACRTHSNPVWREIRRAALGSCVDASSTSSTTAASSGQQSTVETLETVKTTKNSKMRDLLGPVAATFGAALARLPQVACIPLPPALAVTRADDSVAPTPKPKRKLSSASARLEKWCVRPVPVPRACAFRPPLTDSRLAAIQNIPENGGDFRHRGAAPYRCGGDAAAEDNAGSARQPANAAEREVSVYAALGAERPRA
jgi:hypothetical protein